MSIENTSLFPAFVVDVGAGADYTIFTIEGNARLMKNIARANEKAEAYSKKYLRPERISHAIYSVNSQEEFDAIIQRRNKK